MKSCMDLPEATIEGKEEDSASAGPKTCGYARMSVGEIMSRDVATVFPDCSVAEAALKMAEAGISCVVVTERGRIVGILTETDFRKIIVVQGDRIYQTKVADVMSASVESVSADLSVLDASRMMQDKRIRRLPVLDGEKLIGIVTQTDLTRALTSFGHWKDVRDLMSSPVSKIQIGASIVAVARLMNINKISSVIVMSNDDVAGMVTQRDILKKVIAVKKDPKGTRVEEVMTSPVISVPASCSVFSAGKTMLDLNIRRLLIMDNQTACGIITQTDIFQAVENKLQAEEERQDRLLQAVRVEVRAKTLHMAGAALLGGITLAGIVSGIVWWMYRGL
jgi:CBS domain-containing protein